MVGFNRRFSPFGVNIKEFFANRKAPLTLNYRVNAGVSSLNLNHTTRTTSNSYVNSKNSIEGVMIDLTNQAATILLELLNKWSKPLKKVAVL